MRQICRPQKASDCKSSNLHRHPHPPSQWKDTSAPVLWINPLTAGVAYIRFFIFYQHIKYHPLNMLKIKCDIKQQYLKQTDDLQFVKSE